MTEIALNTVAPAPSTHRSVGWVAWGLGTLVVACLIYVIGDLAAKREAGQQSDAIRQTLQIHELGLREAASRYDYLPYLIARHPDVLAVLATPDDPLLRDRVNRLLEDVNQRAGSSAVYVMNLGGTTLSASNWAMLKSFVGQSYRDRPYFTQASRGGQGRFFGVGLTTREAGFFMATPVRRQDGAIIGVAAVKVSLDAIESAWKSLPDPVMLSDALGIVFLSNVEAWKYHTSRPIDEMALERLRYVQQYGDHLTFERLPWAVDRSDGSPRYVVRTQLAAREREFHAIDLVLPDFGWTLTVTADHSGVHQARYTAWALASLVAVALLLAGLYWQLRERRLVEQRNARRDLEQRVRERTDELQQRTLQLQQEYSLKKAMEDSLVVGMRARDLQGRIIYVNPAFSEMTGYAASDLLHRHPPYPYWHPDDMEKHWSDNEATLAGRAVLTGFETRMQHRDGHDVHAMVYTAPLVDAAGTHAGWMSSVVDMSAQRRADEQQRRHDEQLRHAGRLASLGEMASSLAHELNQPLMALSNFAGAARTFAQQGQQQLLAASLDDIAAQSMRAAEIVQRIRSFVRQRTGGVGDCPINALVDSVLALLKPEIQLRRARVLTALEDKLPKVPGDRVLLEQVLLNLVLNSLQAMQDTPQERRLVEITTQSTDTSLVIAVADRGPGIDADAEAHLFEPFFTTKADGLGLGLNICRTIVESHHGRLTFANRPDGGALFMVHLPCTPCPSS